METRPPHKKQNISGSTKDIAKRFSMHENSAIFLQEKCNSLSTCEKKIFDKISGDLATLNAVTIFVCF